MWEPYFSEGFALEGLEGSPAGPSIKIFFDARGRTKETLHPNGVRDLMVYGVPSSLTTPEDFLPTPWEVYTYDGNDNGGRSNLDNINARKFVSHWNTPMSALVDALGRTIVTTERNGTDSSTWQVTTMTYDIRGNLLTVTDPLNRVAAHQLYDLADRPLRTQSIDAGTSTIAIDGGGAPLESHNERGARELTVVDDLLRPTHLWGQDSASESLRLVQKITYGDQAGLADPQADNLLGMPFEHRDEAGKLILKRYDFTGQLLGKVRQVLNAGHLIGAYKDAKPEEDFEIKTYRVDWTLSDSETEGDKDAELLDSFEYQVDTDYDALSRPKRLRYPEDVTGQRKVLTPRFNRAGALQRVDLNGTPYVEEIAYNARGQRTLIAYGNGIMTRYAYDEKSFQLVRLRSEKFQKSSTETTTTYAPDGGKLQDLFYTFDAVGNVQTIESKGEGLGVNPNEYGFLAPEKWGQFTANSLLRLFEYDPLYRVTTATGRERKALEPVPWGNQIPGGSGFEDARPYFESYEYDKAGNLTEKKHEYPQALIGGTATWKRTYTQESGSNRMVSMGLGSESYAYQYDPGGNLVQENTERHYEWDHAGQMKAFRVQPTGSPASKYGAYAYDGGGQRVLKVSIQGSVPHSTVYIDGIFEHHRIHLEGEGEEVEENNDLHIMDDASRVAIHRIGPDIFDTQKPALQYQLGDHLGSSNVVVDGGGDLINREEYRPYGESSFGSFAKKRYRFTGKERDEESGLYYHGARYYAPWLCRWTAVDPAGMVDGPNLYAYVRGNPVRLVDPSGLEGQQTTVGEIYLIEGLPVTEEMRSAMQDSSNNDSEFDNIVVRVATDADLAYMEENNLKAMYDPSTNEIIVSGETFSILNGDLFVASLEREAVRILFHEISHAFDHFLERQSNPNHDATIAERLNIYLEDEIRAERLGQRAMLEHQIKNNEGEAWNSLLSSQYTTSIIRPTIASTAKSRATELFTPEVRDNYTRKFAREEIPGVAEDVAASVVHNADITSRRIFFEQRLSRP